MHTLIQILIAILVLSFPIVFFMIYIKTLESKSQQTMKMFMTESSELYKDLTVWVKNFDITKRKNKFELNPFQTTYDFYECDLILNLHNFIVVGKTKMLGKSISLKPTIFTFEEQSVSAEVKAIRENGKDLEIDFLDSFYTNEMTLVIKRIDFELKEKIKTVYNSGYKQKARHYFCSPPLTIRAKPDVRTLSLTVLS
jgi:hypothetical protein